MQRATRPIFFFVYLVIFAWCTHLSPTPAYALSAGMSASYVYGQSLFTTGGSGTKANLLTKPSGVALTDSKVIITDTGNQRVLIFNSFPSSNAPSADMVLGQSSFTTNTASLTGCGFNFITTTPMLGSATTDGTKLYIADSGNNRIFIYNTFPKTAGACPDVVVGQTGTVVTTAGTLANKLNQPAKAFAAGGRLFVADSNNNRVLIFNSIPSGNNANADIVLGQTVFTASGSGLLANKLSGPRSVASDGRHVVVADSGNNRILIWNTIPTTSGVNADIVLGQTDFVSNQVDGINGVPSSSSVGTPEDVFIDSAGKLYATNSVDHRILIWNTIPTKNNQSADVVVGQSDFLGGGSNASETLVSNQGLNTPLGVAFSNGYLFVADSGNNRTLAFQNIVTPPAVDSDNQILFGKNGLLRLRGTANTNALYTIQSVQYSVNGGDYQTANASKGSFGTDSSADFTVDFNPLAGNPIGDGYTLRLKSQNNNNDISNGFLYFQPFLTIDPPNNSYTDNTLPSFTFSVNRQRTILRDNLASYDVMVRVDGGGWQTYLSGIPVDFFSVKTQPENIRSAQYTAPTNNGTYETKDYTAVYSNDSSTIQVRAKDPSRTSFSEGGMTLEGSVQWKVVATDQGGHFQETPTSVVRIGSHEALQTVSIFPLAVLNISGFGNPGLNSCNLNETATSFVTTSDAPIFYGIANIGATVSLDVTDTNCITPLLCKRTYTTIANAQSRFGINIPKGDVTPQHDYTMWLRASLNGNYVELPPFMLTIR